MKDNESMRAEAINQLHTLADHRISHIVAAYIDELERQLVEERQRRWYLEGYSETLFRRVIELESKA